MQPAGTSKQAMGRSDRRNDNVAQNPRVSPCFIVRSELLSESCSVDDASAIASGDCRRFTEADELALAIRLLLARRAPQKSAEENAACRKEHLRHCAFWRVDMESTSGKERETRNG